MSGLSPVKRAKRDIAMLQCFVDESGYNDGPVLVLAGYLANVDTWKAFTVEWQECLDMRPRLQHFRMSEAFDSGGDASMERVARFHRIIDEHAVGSVSVTLPVKSYRNIFGQIPIWKDPYVYLLFHLILAYRLHCDRLQLDRKVKFIFDRQKGAAPRIAQAWEFFEQEGTGRLLEIMGGAPSFENKTDFLPLQAADLMAWWIRRQIADRLEGKEPPAFPWKIKDSVPTIALRFTEDDLRRDYALMFDAGDIMEQFFRPRMRWGSHSGEG